MIRSVTVALILCGAGPWLAAASQATQQPIRADVNTVLVDVVVRGRNGKALRDLKPVEIEVLENGVPQKVLSFREVRTAGTPRADLEPVVQGGRGGSIQINRQIRLVSLIFERLGNQSRTIARSAAQEFLRLDLGPNVYYAVFYIDRTFRPVLSYTNDRQRILRGIDLATAGDKSSMANDTQLLRGTGQGSGVAPVADAAARMPPPDHLFVDMLTGMERFNERMDRDMFGRVSIFSLWGVIAELSRLPGRKSVLYFSEGLTLPGSLLEQYYAMISAANRANVTVNTIDARGLLSATDMANAVRYLGQAATGSVETRAADPVPQFTNELAADIIPRQMLSGDFVIDSIHGNSQMNLTDLAERTGGMAIYNTNDFRQALREMSEEFNTYYEVTYNPGDLVFDGRFRAITVKVSRPGTSLQARNGYFALPPAVGGTVFPYEVPLLHALGRTPLPQDLKFKAGALQFGQRDGMRQVSLVFDLPLRDITFTEDKEKKLARSHVSVLSLVKDDSGRVVEKLSRDVAMNHPLEKVAGFQSGRFISTRAIELPPGRYTIESAVGDQEKTIYSARRSVLVVTPPADGPRISDMALVRRLDRIPEEREAGDQLYLQDSRVVPTLDEEILGGSSRLAAVFLVVYPDAGSPEPPRMTIEILRDGKLLNQGNPPLPPVNASGACPYVLNIGLGGMEPAQYELRATVAQGDRLTRRSLFVTIREAGQPE